MSCTATHCREMGRRRGKGREGKGGTGLGFFFFFSFFFLPQTLLPVMPARPGIPHLCTEAAKTSAGMLRGVGEAELPTMCPDTRHRPRDRASCCSAGAFTSSEPRHASLCAELKADLLDGDRQE